MKVNNIKIQLSLQKLKNIKKRNNRNINFFLLKNSILNKTNCINNLSRNNSNKAKNIITSSSTKIFPLKLMDINNDKNNFNKNNSNLIIHSYKDKKNQNIKINNNIRTILFGDDKMTKLKYKQRNRNNSALKVNQAVNTISPFLYNNDNKMNYNYKLKYKPLPINKNLKKLLNIHDFNAIYFLSRKKLQSKKFNQTIKDCYTERLKRDKYAYIYLSDNAESIKFSRRVNYNPLSV